jgi:hypothetical protein
MTAGGECHMDAVPVPLGADPKFRTTAAVRFPKVERCRLAPGLPRLVAALKLELS